MDRYEFSKWLLEEYESVFGTHFASKLLENVLDYANGMTEIDQYNYLCKMIPLVPEKIIRTVNY